MASVLILSRKVGLDLVGVPLLDVLASEYFDICACCAVVHHFSDAVATTFWADFQKAAGVFVIGEVDNGVSFVPFRELTAVPLVHLLFVRSL
jgi:hypothetical protein